MKQSLWAAKAAEYARVQRAAQQRMLQLSGARLSELASEVLQREVELSPAQFAMLWKARYQIVERRGIVMFADTKQRLTPTERALADELVAMELIDKQNLYTVRYGLEDVLAPSFDGLDVLGWVEEHA